MYSDIYLERLRTIIKYPSVDSRHSGRNSNPKPPSCMSEAIPLRLTYEVCVKFSCRSCKCPQYGVTKTAFLLKTPNIYIYIYIYIYILMLCRHMRKLQYVTEFCSSGNGECLAAFYTMPHCNIFRMNVRKCSTIWIIPDAFISHCKQTPDARK
jgi:hypothetical protein